MRRFLVTAVLLSGAAWAQDKAPAPAPTAPANAAPAPVNPASANPAPVAEPNLPAPPTVTFGTAVLAPINPAPAPAAANPAAANPATDNSTATPAAKPAVPDDPYALKVLSVAELSRKAQVIVRANVGAPLTIKQGEENWRVYPLDILETLAGDAQALPKIKYQDKGQALERPALWIYADPQEAPKAPSGESVLFLYSGLLDSPLVGYSQGAFTVNNSRVQGLPDGTPNVAAQVPSPAMPTSVTANGNPSNTAAINSSAPPAPQTAPAVAPEPSAPDSSSPSNTSSASLPPSVPPTSAASAANMVNGDLKPAAPPAAASSATAQPAAPAPLPSGQLLLEDFRKLVLSARTGAKP